MAEIRFERQDQIGILTLARPDKLNALTHEMGDMFREHVERINLDEGIRVVVLRAEGRAFSAGGDLEFLRTNAARSFEDNRVGMRSFYEKFLSLRLLNVPSIAMMQGRATGAGLTLALGCDMRVAEEGAKLSASFVRVGLNPGMGGTILLERLIGPARAAELIFTGRDVSMGEALAIGLVNHVVQADRLEEATLSLARQISANAPKAVRLAKAMMQEEPRTLEAALEREAEGQAICFASDDLQEGIRAIQERRAPVFTNR